MGSFENIKDLVNKLYDYFGAKPIGSYVLFLNDLIAFEDINDIDFIVTKDRSENLFKYLSDLGYSQTIVNGPQVGYKNGSVIYERLPQGDFKKNESLSIDISIDESTNVWLCSEIIKSKFERGTQKDFETLQKIIQKKLNKKA